MHPFDQTVRDIAALAAELRKLGATINVPSDPVDMARTVAVLAHIKAAQHAVRFAAQAIAELP